MGFIMTLKRRATLLFLFTFLFQVVWAGTSLCYPQQVVEKKEASLPQKEETPEKIFGAPQNVKEKAGIWVFVAWMWISVFVLVYFLRLKIAEADRLHGIRFYSIKKD
jgi:hypothetical protein